jgi:hypothetical protein
MQWQREEALSPVTLTTDDFRLVRVDSWAEQGLRTSFRQDVDGRIGGKRPRPSRRLQLDRGDAKYHGFSWTRAKRDDRPGALGGGTASIAEGVNASGLLVGSTTIEHRNEFRAALGA